MNNKDNGNLIQLSMPRVAGIDLRKEMSERPYVVLGLGVVAGYVLGGGLFTRLTGRLLVTGLRAVALPLMTKAALNFVESAVQAQPEPAPNDTPAGTAPAV